MSNWQVSKSNWRSVYDMVVKMKLTRMQLRQLILETLEEEMLDSIPDEDDDQVDLGEDLSAKTKATLKKKAEKIITKKFCSCIKKVAKKFKKEGIAIGICTKSVVRGKGLKRGKFRCKKSRKMRLYKGGKRGLKKSTRRKNKIKVGCDIIYE